MAARRRTALPHALVYVVVCWLCVGLAGCNASEESSSGTTVVQPTAPVAFLQQPFRGFFLNSAPFDHDLPLSLQGDGNNEMLTWWGGRIRGIWSGHHGHDWLLPEGTPVLAAAAGTVIYADFEPPFLCGERGMVSALVVRLRHRAPSGETFDTQYLHLSRLDVTLDEQVQAGQQLGLSGMTGCTGGPHLHFDVIRLAQTNNGQPAYIDPFGWQGSGADPWAQHPDGAPSVWLWKTGQEPDAGKLMDLVWGPGTLIP